MGGSDSALRRQRHYTLNYLVRSSPIRVHGDICEVGCWRGLSTHQIAQEAREANEPVTLHVFDSFQGLSEYSQKDQPSGVYIDIERTRCQFACPLDQVKENLAEFDFIKFYPGWVPDRFPEVSDLTFSFVHIDVDLYQPTRDSFAFFYPRLAENGIMAFDDYGSPQFPGAKLAIDEVLQQLGHPRFVPLPSGQAFLIKG
jgi:hypothetical protein